MFKRIFVSILRVNYNWLMYRGNTGEVIKRSTHRRAISRCLIQQHGQLLPGRDAGNRQVGTLLPLPDGVALAAAGDQHQHMTAIAQ